MEKTTPPRVLIIGGGAAGFMAAVTAAESGAAVALWERGSRVLAKVRISGGGRCNVTNALEDPSRFVENYPRGGKELLGVLHRFGAKDTRAWFESRGVALKTEPDGRVFPCSDDSASVVDALVEAARRSGVRVETGVTAIDVKREGESFVAAGRVVARVDRLLLATGSGAQGHAWARRFGHAIVPPVPSLFTFTVKDTRLAGLSGLSTPRARLALEGAGFASEGPLLVTHWGLSGPAVLRLSAWGARWLHGKNYHAVLRVNWTGEAEADVWSRLMETRKAFPRRRIVGEPLDPLPQRLWERLVSSTGVPPTARWADLGNDPLRRLAAEIVDGRYAVSGKGAFKEEFVTAGGVALAEVDFKTMESRKTPGLFFAGEILDIDGVTGGFNFQSAWATGWTAGRALAGRRD